MTSNSSYWLRIVNLIALIGWLPFLAALLFTIFPVLLPIDFVVFERAMIGYGALILAFLGGVRWGVRLQGGAGSDLTFIIGIIGSVLGLVTLLMPYSLAVAILTVGFGAQGAWDVWSGMRGSVPGAYAQMRSFMTLLVCFTLIATLMARGLIGMVAG